MTHRRGANAVEFALMLPSMMLLLVGSADFALWAHAHQVLSRSVQDGARVGSMVLLAEEATAEPIEQAAEQATRLALRLSGYDADAAVVSTEWRADAEDLSWLEVVAQIQHTSLIGDNSPFQRPIRKRFRVVTQEQGD